MASNLLSIVYQESQPIEEEKLKFICTKHNIWDHFKMSKTDYASFSDYEKMQMLKRFYTDLVPVYYVQGKNFSCCKDCLLMTAQDKIILDAKLMFCIAIVHLTMKNLFYLLRGRNKFLINSGIFFSISCFSY